MTKHKTTLMTCSAVALTLFITLSPIADAQNAAKAIPQPTVTDLKVAPDSARLDLELPDFSNPTKITNPFFPISSQESVLLLGKVDGKRFRTEVTLLPYSRIVTWNGMQIEAAVSQYVAFLDGRLEEIAIDLYAQADDGSVWYLGEDVSDFSDGAIITKEGTWHAGIDGPPAMIMPGQPKLGDVYRPENMPGIAFEEVQITKTNVTVDGPFGKIAGSIVGSELHMDGSSEDKYFAPGYGEFNTANADGDHESLALAIPIDKASGEMPAAMADMNRALLEIIENAKSKQWRTAESALQQTETAKALIAANDIPLLVGPLLDDALKTLQNVVKQRHSGKAAAAAIELARLGLDLQLRYRSRAGIDLARLDLWAAQLQLDAVAGQEGAVRGDTFTMALIKDRIIRDLSPTDAQKVNVAFGNLLPAAKDAELGDAAVAATDLREIIKAIRL